MYSTILVPTDGSETATRAVDYAVDVADTYDATVHALSVVDAGDLGLRTPPDVDVEELRRPLRERAQSAVDAVVRAGEAADVPVVAAVRVGVVHRTILDYAEENEVDLVVMGTHGRSGLSRALLGSVTEQVVRESSAPVLTVAPDGRREQDA
ncbi:Nucleotide-binding universal stress protein, UspA family [Halogranum amylolyticum]|uniref:Nucleotide-binding universal stress protein, UspA family n=1 Tax=Halogranum amylolyticum TaxID=660520 RepID=A0A1H8MVP0_9EURY|nr:universal stress protein [Halogranum amylolyticum]SEO21432.1 Nucleotide-binding universal stress protein, UspA family [Halogranum amylolyticum]